MLVWVAIKSNLATITITLYWSSFLWAKMPNILPTVQKLSQSSTMPFPRLLLTGTCEPHGMAAVGRDASYPGGRTSERMFLSKPYLRYGRLFSLIKIECFLVSISYVIGAGQPVHTTHSHRSIRFCKQTLLFALFPYASHQLYYHNPPYVNPKVLSFKRLFHNLVRFLHGMPYLQ